MDQSGLPHPRADPFRLNHRRSARRLGRRVATGACAAGPGGAHRRSGLDGEIASAASAHAAPRINAEARGFCQPRGLCKRQPRLLGAYWDVEYPRLWNLAQTGREFLQRFPQSAGAAAVQAEMIQAILRCLNAPAPTGKEALAWVEKILARRDLAPDVAVPIYSHQLNMIGIIARGGTIDSLVAVPRDSSDVGEATDALLAQFATRFPGTPELGRLYLFAASFGSARTAPVRCG